MNKTAVTILVLVIVVVGGYFLLKGPKATAPGSESTVPVGTETPENPATSSMPVPGENTSDKQAIHVVAYTNAGFSPSTVTIKAGDTVTWENESSQNMWVASGIHPTHILYSGTSLSAHCPDAGNTAFDACEGVAPGGSWSFTFTKAGSWSYHDHLHASLYGKVIVE